jgi:hypothetical protein
VWATTKANPHKVIKISVHRQTVLNRVRIKATAVLLVIAQTKDPIHPQTISPVKQIQIRIIRPKS